MERVSILHAHVYSWCLLVKRMLEIIITLCVISVKPDGRRLNVPVVSIIKSSAECTILSTDIKISIAFALTSVLKMA
jgi:hypothetical protein